MSMKLYFVYLIGSYKVANYFQLFPLDLAESDIMYTKTITGSGREDFKDKTILILGGGDGGILNELLQYSPKFVTMVDVSFQSFRIDACWFNFTMIIIF